jgi:hypothetical protein
LQLDMKWQRLFIPLVPITCLLAGPARLAGPEALVNSYENAAREQNVRLRGASMEVDIEASLPKLQKHGRLRALRRISRLGRITYESLRFEGDNTIKNSVIARYVAGETQGQWNEGTLAITPANYKFKYRGLSNREGQQVHVFQLTPRKKRVGLFKGELWLDAETCLPLRESGRFVKSPSIFLRRIEFVREYEIRDGVAIPRQIESTVETRLVGKAELTFRFHNISLAENPALTIAAASSE